MADENTTGEGNQPEMVLKPETTQQDITPGPTPAALAGPVRRVAVIRAAVAVAAVPVAADVAGAVPAAAVVAVVTAVAGVTIAVAVVRWTTAARN